MGKKTNKINKERTTENKEFVCSTFQWIPREKQKERAKELEDMTKEK